MADFCFQCSLDMFFGPPGDMNGLCKEGYSVPVLCEGCGYTWVDHRGWCIAPGCDLHHGEAPPERSEALRSVWRAWGRRSGPLGWAYRLHDRWLGSSWEPGRIHYPGHWPWYVVQLYRAVRDGEQMPRVDIDFEDFSGMADVDI